MKFSLKTKSLVFTFFMLIGSLLPMAGAVHASALTSPLVQFAAHNATTGSCVDYRSAQGRTTIQLIPAWDKYLDCDAAKDGAIGHFSFPADLWLVAIAGLEILLRLALYLAVGFIIYGGVYMIISQGNPEKIQLARQTIEQAITGLVIALLATAIIRLVEGSIT